MLESHAVSSGRASGVLRVKKTSDHPLRRDTPQCRRKCHQGKTGGQKNWVASEEIWVPSRGLGSSSCVTRVYLRGTIHPI